MAHQWPWVQVHAIQPVAHLKMNVIAHWIPGLLFNPRTVLHHAECLPSSHWIAAPDESIPSLIDRSYVSQDILAPIGSMNMHGLELTKRRPAIDCTCDISRPHTDDGAGDGASDCLAWASQYVVAGMTVFAVVGGSTIRAEPSFAKIVRHATLDVPKDRLLVIGAVQWRRGRGWHEISLCDLDSGGLCAWRAALAAQRRKLLTVCTRLIADARFGAIAQLLRDCLGHLMQAGLAFERRESR